MKKILCSMLVISGFVAEGMQQQPGGDRRPVGGRPTPITQARDLNRSVQGRGVEERRSSENFEKSAKNALFMDRIVSQLVPSQKDELGVAIYFLSNYLQEGTEYDPARANELLKDSAFQLFRKNVRSFKMRQTFSGYDGKDHSTIHDARTNDGLGLSIPMFALKNMEAKDFEIFLAAYRLLDPNYVSSINEGGHSLLAHAAQNLLDVFEKDLNFDNFGSSLAKLKTVADCFLLDSAMLRNRKLFSIYSGLDILDRIIVWAAVFHYGGRITGQGIDELNERRITDQEIDELIRIRDIMELMGAVKISRDWSSSLTIRNRVIPFVQSGYWDDILEGEKTPEKWDEFYQKSDHSALVQPPTRKLDELREETLAQRDVLFLNLAKERSPFIPYLLEKLAPWTLKDNVVHLLVSIDSQKQIDLADIASKDPQSAFNKLKEEIAYEYFDGICKNFHIRRSFRDYNSIVRGGRRFENLQHLRNNGLTIPMFVVQKNNVSNLQAFLSAYELMDPFFSIQKVEVTGRRDSHYLVSDFAMERLLSTESIESELVNAIKFITRSQMNLSEENRARLQWPENKYSVLEYAVGAMVQQIMGGPLLPFWESSANKMKNLLNIPGIASLKSAVGPLSGYTPISILVKFFLKITSKTYRDSHGQFSVMIINDGVVRRFLDVFTGMIKYNSQDLIEWANDTVPQLRVNGKSVTGGKALLDIGRNLEEYWELARIGSGVFFKDYFNFVGELKNRGVSYSQDDQDYIDQALEIVENPDWLRRNGVQDQ